MKEQPDGTVVTVLDDGKTIATEDQIDKQLNKIDDWEQWEASVKQILFSTISNQQLLDIQNLVTVMLMWEKLEILHDGKTEIVVVAKHKQLNNMICDDNYDVQLHISNMKKLHKELTGMRAPVLDVDFCGMLSASLPDSYNNLISMLMANAHSNNMPLTPNALIMHIESEADFCDSKKKPKQPKQGGSALVATESTKSNKLRQSDRKQGKHSHGDGVRCENCGWLGHTKPQCWQKGGGQEGQGPLQLAKKKREQGNSQKLAESANAASVKFAYACTSDFSAIANSLNKVPAECQGAIVDCGASAHFSPAHNRIMVILLPQLAKAISRLSCQMVQITQQ